MITKLTLGTGAVAAGFVGILVLAGCSQRRAPVVSFAPPSDLGGFDALLTARGVT